MAGMFYSVNEAADRLGKTEDEVRQLAKDGKLREFRDGSHILFKVDEVNALVAEGIDTDLDAISLELGAPEESEEALDVQPPAMVEEGADDMLSLLEEEPAPAEPAAEAEASAEMEELAAEPELEASSEMDLVAEPEAEASSEMELAAEPEAEASSEMDLAAESGAGTGTGEDDLLFLDEGEKTAGSGMDEAAETDEEIALAPETGAETSGSDITDMDTALTGEGVNVLGETDAGYDVTDDSMAETVGPAASAGAAGTGTGSGAGTDVEASLEEVEEDLNLDSFGSGSGLLDLSLQADDTSLGGILDEIYTAEGGDEGAVAAVAEPGSVEDMTAEAEQVATEEELAAPEVAVAAPAIAAAYPAYAEAAPDTQSNVLGMLLILPLLALLYTTIVAISGQRHVVPSILSSIQGMIWYIVGGLVVVSVVVFGATFVMGGERTKRAAPKKAKETKVKVAKAAKEKAPKAEKTPEKPAKEKKGLSLFGKKKEKK
ncbi:MAG: excisionase family DNA-binding protein [Sedimentisphaerales bacterium]|nr:excisionase family DNA-binding protein [Sedimentisphaerales bacterium]